MIYTPRAVLEALISVAAVILCWFAIAVTPKHDLSLKGYAGLIFLGAVAIYFIVRFVHWAWITPIPLLNR